MMIARRILGLALAAMSGWLGWQSVAAVRFIAVQTGSVADVVADPVYAMPLAATALAGLGGLAALFRLPAGAVLGLAGALVYILFGVATLMLGGDQTMWLPKMVFGSVLLVLALGLWRMPRKST